MTEENTDNSIVGRLFKHRKTGKLVKVVSVTGTKFYGFVNLLHISSQRRTRKQWHYFDYDYLPVGACVYLALGEWEIVLESLRIHSEDCYTSHDPPELKGIIDKIDIGLETQLW